MLRKQRFKHVPTRTASRKTLLEFLRVLMKTGATRFGLFRLSSGKLTPYYVDLRLVPSDPKGLQTVMRIYENMMTSEVGLSSFERIAGVPTAGVPYAAILAYNLVKPFLYVRREWKSHGGERRIEGQLLPGDRVVIIDDLVTTGKNTIQAAEAIRAEGGQVAHVLVLIDRQEGGGQALVDAGLTLHAFATITEVAEQLARAGVLEDDQYQAIMKQVITRPDS